MFRVYSKEQSGKFYLSPYTDVYIDDEKLVIRQTIFECIVSLNTTPENSICILNALQQGIKEKEFYALLKKAVRWNEIQKTIYEWLRKGVLE